LVDADTFGLVVMPVPGVSLADAEAAMDGVVAKFLKDGVAPADFARIKTQIRASEIYARDSAMGMAQEYGQALAVGLSIDDVKAWPQVLQEVTEADVMAAATAIFNRNNAVTGWLTTKEGAAQ
jgi:zinc protease